MDADTVQIDEIQDDTYHSTPLKRIMGHHLLDSSSFLNISKFYYICVPIIVLILLMSLRLGVFALLLSKSDFVPFVEEQVNSFKESYYLGISLTAVPQILVWSVLVYGLMILMGGKGKFLRSVSIFSIAQIPIVLGLIILLFIGIAQPEATISTSILVEEIFTSFNTAFSGYNLANNILYPITSFYSSLIAGVGLSTEHKVPALIGVIAGIMAFVASMIFYYFI